MQRIYFISDVHLGADPPAEEQDRLERLLAFLNVIREQGADLCIVGDLFDFWFEYRHVLPRGSHRVVTALEDIVHRGGCVRYLPGNHDFAIDGFFSRDIGVTIEQQRAVFRHDGKTFYVHHGDGLCPRDTGYRIIRGILRNRFAQWGFRWLHPDIGFAVARIASRSSRAYTASKEYGAEDGMLEEARKRIAEGADFVVMGHRHRPEMVRIANGVYVNLGDWITHFTYAVYREGRMELVSVKDGAPVILDSF
ncbi:MAG: UDP-2,3-diacylglucosamine diphosphatase [Bacteroidota bacterium]|nr:UDP-2,3-diacylglucosamine diphosphatase [Bacteroidota bacterium]